MHETHEPPLPDTVDGGGEAAPFLADLNEEDRALATAQGWQGVDSVFQGYRGLQAQLSEAVTPPKQDAGPEEQAAFYRDLAKAWTPEDGYQFRMPETLPDSFAYDQSFADEANGWFQEAGLHPAAAQLLHDRWLDKMAEQHASLEQEAANSARSRDETVAAAHQALVREYGEPASPAYQNLISKADRALSALKRDGVDLSGWFTDKGALTGADENGLQQVADPTAVKLLAYIHDTAFTEDTLDGVGTVSGGANPFDADTPDLKGQSDLLERNPARARQLVLAAGRDPKLFRL